MIMRTLGAKGGWKGGDKKRNGKGGRRPKDRSVLQTWAFPQKWHFKNRVKKEFPRAIRGKPAFCPNSNQIRLILSSLFSLPEKKYLTTK